MRGAPCFSLRPGPHPRTLSLARSRLREPQALARDADSRRLPAVHYLIPQYDATVLVWLLLAGLVYAQPPGRGSADAAFEKFWAADGRTVFNGRVQKDLRTLMQWAAIDNDRTMLFGAELHIDLQR